MGSAVTGAMITMKFEIIISSFPMHFFAAQYLLISHFKAND